MKRAILFLLVLFGLLNLAGCAQGKTAGVGGKVTVIAKTGRYGQAMWSPDGKRIVVLHTDAKGYPQVEVLAETGEPIQTVIRSASVGSPGWVGDHVGYLSREVDDSSSSLKVASERNHRTILQAPDLSVALWSRDGSTVVLRRRDDDLTNLWLLNTDTNSYREVWNGELAQKAKLSPSGRYVALNNLESSAISVLDLDKGTVQELWRVSPGTALVGLAWSPDEQYVGVRLVGDGRNDGFYLLPREGGLGPALLSKEDMVDPDWSPSGDRIVYATVGVPGRNQLRVLQLPADWKARLATSGQ